MSPVDPDKYSIFISHAAVDEELATTLKEYLGKALPGERIFVSSDPDDLRLGDEWVPKILSALQTAKFVLVLATERGLSRKWVWFEAGRTWFSVVTMLPCCLGKVRKNDLPAPFSGRMAANLDDTRDVELLFKKLKEVFGDLAAVPDYEDVAKTMTRLDVRAEERDRLKDDPLAAERMNDIEKQMLELSPAEKETIRQFVLYGELSTAAVQARVKATGIDMNRFSVPDHLIKVTGWLSSKPGNKPYDDMKQNQYGINPTMRPFLEIYFSRKQ